MAWTEAGNPPSSWVGKRVRQDARVSADSTTQGTVLQTDPHGRVSVDWDGGSDGSHAVTDLVVVV